MDTLQTLNTEMGMPTPPAESSPAEEPKDATTQSLPNESGTEPAKPAEGESSGEPLKGAAQSEDDSRFDKHPRWQEMLRERNESREKAIALEAEIRTIKEMMAQSQRVPERTQEQKPSRDYDAEISKLDEQLESGDISLTEHRQKERAILRDQQREEASRIRQEAEKSVQTVLQQKTAQELQTKFLADNPRFMELKNAGKLDQIKKSDPYGFHDDFSAYLAMQLQEAEDAKSKAVEQAIKETEDRVLKNMKAKRESMTLGPGPSSAPADDEKTPPELKNPKKFGGVTSVLASRLAAKRSKGEV